MWNCPDAARTLPGNCPDDSPDAARMLRRTLQRTLRRMPRRMLRGANFGADIHRRIVRRFPPTAWTRPGNYPEIARTRTGSGHSCGLTADWSWTGRGCGHLAGHSPTSARTLPVHCPDASRILPGCCPDDSPAVARTLRRTLRGNCAAVARLAALFFNKGMVSNQNDRLSNSRKPPKIPFD